MQIEKEYSAFLSPNRFSDYDITTTGADGSYNLKFTPLGTGKFFLRVVNAPIYYMEGGVEPIGSYHVNGLTLGSTDSLNFTLVKLINLTVHLKNNSKQGKTACHIFVLSYPELHYGIQSDEISPVIIDTTFSYRLPQLTAYTFQTVFYNPILTGPNVGTFVDSLSFKKNFYMGKADTSLVVVNP